MDIQGKMSKEELKELIVELRMQIINMNIGKGNCPYAFYHIGDEYDECGRYSCNRCKDIFFRKMRAIVKKEVALL